MAAVDSKWCMADYAVLAELSRGLSGWYVLNVCVNATHAGSVEAEPLQGIKRDSLSRYLHPFF
jgi:hypothetical protein